MKQTIEYCRVRIALSVLQSPTPFCAMTLSPTLRGGRCSGRGALPHLQPAAVLLCCWAPQVDSRFWLAQVRLRLSTCARPPLATKSVLQQHS